MCVCVCVCVCVCICVCVCVCVMLTKFIYDIPTIKIHNLTPHKKNQKVL